MSSDGSAGSKYKSEYGAVRSVLNSMTPEERAQYNALRGHKAKQAFRERFAAQVAMSAVEAMKYRKDRETRTDGVKGTYVPKSKIYQLQGVTTYPKLEESDPEDVKAAENYLAHCDARDGPWRKYNTATKRFDYLNVEKFLESNFCQTRGIDARGFMDLGADDVKQLLAEEVVDALESPRVADPLPLPGLPGAGSEKSPGESSIGTSAAGTGEEVPTPAAAAGEEAKQPEEPKAPPKAEAKKKAKQLQDPKIKEYNKVRGLYVKMLGTITKAKAMSTKASVDDTWKWASTFTPKLAEPLVVAENVGSKYKGYFDINDYRCVQTDDFMKFCEEVLREIQTAAGPLEKEVNMIMAMHNAKLAQENPAKRVKKEQADS